MWRLTTYTLAALLLSGFTSLAFAAPVTRERKLYHRTQEIILNGNTIGLGEHLGNGASAEGVWKATNRYPGCAFDLVVKQFHGDGLVEDDEVADEVRVVRAVGDYCTHGVAHDGRTYLAMRLRPGTLLTESARWHAVRAAPRAQCVAFLGEFRRALAGEIMRVHETHGHQHPDPNMRNVLVESTAQAVTAIHLIDWGFPLHEDEVETAAQVLQKLATPGHFPDALCDAAAPGSPAGGGAKRAHSPSGSSSGSSGSGRREASRKAKAAKVAHGAGAASPRGGSPKAAAAMR